MNRVHFPQESVRVGRLVLLLMLLVTKQNGRPRFGIVETGIDRWGQGPSPLCGGAILVLTILFQFVFPFIVVFIIVIRQYGQFQRIQIMQCQDPCHEFMFRHGRVMG